MSKTYQLVTEKIIQSLESVDENSWTKPWVAQAAKGSPRSFKTQKPYSGINRFLLSLVAWEKGYASNRWLTYKQASELGLQVRKGEKSCPVVFFKTYEKENESTPNDPDTIYFSTHYSAFNLSQCEGAESLIALENSADPLAPILTLDQKLENAETFARNTGAAVTFERRDMAAYSPMLDKVILPPFETFKTREGYYSTLFHELGHWTGHETRLNRDQKNVFGSGKYAYEELVAELSAAFLCADHGLEYTASHAPYIKGWLKKLASDVRQIPKAAAAAEKACRFMRDLQPGAKLPENTLQAIA